VHQRREEAGGRKDLLQKNTEDRPRPQVGGGQEARGKIFAVGARKRVENNGKGSEGSS